MAMTYLQLQDSVCHMIGDFHGGTRAKVQRWLNDARNSLWERTSGNFKEVTDYLTTSEDYDSDDDTTVTVTNGSTTVTSDGTSDTVFTSAMVGRFVQLDGTDPWYQIASVTSGTELELADAYIGESDTECEFEVHTFIHEVASDVERLIQVTVEATENETELAILDRVDVHARLPVPLRWSRGSPAICWIDEQSSSGGVRIGIYPVPDAQTLVRYRYEKTVTEMDDNDDTVGIPGADNAVQAMALVKAMSFKNRLNLVAFWQQKADIEEQKVQAFAGRTRRTSWRMQDRTDAGRRRGIAVNLGSRFGRN